MIISNESNFIGLIIPDYETLKTLNQLTDILKFHFFNNKIATWMNKIFNIYYFIMIANPSRFFEFLRI